MMKPRYRSCCGRGIALTIASSCSSHRALTLLSIDSHPSRRARRLIDVAVLISEDAFRHSRSSRGNWSSLMEAISFSLLLEPLL